MWCGARYVCLYDVEERVLLRRVSISANRSLDGVLDQLNSRALTDAGPAHLIDDAPDDADPLLPPTTAGAALVRVPAPARTCRHMPTNADAGRQLPPVPPGQSPRTAAWGSVCSPSPSTWRAECGPWRSASRIFEDCHELRRRCRLVADRRCNSFAICVQTIITMQSWP